MKCALVERFTQLYGQPPTVIARAPGRIEFIGNHTDYNGGTVLGAAINLGVWVAAGPAPAGTLRFASESHPGVVAVAPDNPRRHTGAQSWVNYPLGVWVSFREFGMRRPEGLEFLAMANLPSRAGLSSSAAIELASALALAGLTGENPSRETIAKLGRHAENHFVGMPCGILDQGVAAFGRRNHLVFIDCRGPRFETAPLPAGAHFWIFNTHTSRALIDGFYAARHRECMDAARALGVALLADVTPADLDRHRTRLPAVILRRATHVVGEIDRVARVRAILARGDGAAGLAEIGRLLVASHRSSQHNFENSTPELDFLADTLADAPHVFGARLTGGGFGGAVMALTGPDFSTKQAEQAADAYAGRFGSRPDIIHCKTDDGAKRVAA